MLCRKPVLDYMWFMKIKTVGKNEYWCIFVGLYNERTHLLCGYWSLIIVWETSFMSHTWHWLPLLFQQPTESEEQTSPSMNFCSWMKSTGVKDPPASPEPAMLVLWRRKQSQDRQPKPQAGVCPVARTGLSTFLRVFKSFVGFKSLTDS